MQNNESSNLSGHYTVSDIKGNIDPSIEALIHKLYSKIEVKPIRDLVISIKGEDIFTDGFMNYIKDKDYTSWGFINLRFIIDNTNGKHLINNDDYEDFVIDMLGPYM